MEIFKIYEAGGMDKFGKNRFEESNSWRVDIEERLKNNCKCNVKIINPNNYYNFLDSTTYDTDREIMEFDLHKLKSSNLIICNFNDAYSLGTMAEIAIAHDRKIPIIGLNEKKQSLHPWQQEMCSKIFSDRELLVLYVIKYYLN